MNKEIRIRRNVISDNERAYIIAEMSANHLFDYKRAEKIVEEAAKAGADAIKLQTYTPDTITFDSKKSYFQITQGTIWDGTTLHKLYQTAYTPWEWQEKLMKKANDLGMDCFSSPFDPTAVDFMEKLNMPAYKIASFEITDIPLIRKIARIGKPIIISTGIAYPEDIKEALKVCEEENNKNIILLKCTSAYPSPYEEINLRTIADMASRYDCITGLSDHTLGCEVAVAAVAVGAKVIEKHLTLKRSDKGPDAAFSMQPEEFKYMVDSIRNVEKAMGKATYELSDKQINSREHSRSLFTVADIERGERITTNNVRSIRPAFGMHTRYYNAILGKKLLHNIEAGEPIRFADIDMDMRVVIIANGDEEIGLGHIRRTVPIAVELAKRNVEVYYITESVYVTQYMDTHNNTNGIKVFIVDDIKLIPKKMDELRITHALVDRYNLTDKQLVEVRKHCNKLICFDDIDLEHGRHYSSVDILINTKLGMEKYTANTNIKKYLFGSDYAIINDEFLNAPKRKNNREISHKQKNVLILTGGANNYNMAKQLILNIANRDKKITYTVLLGPASKKEDVVEITKLETLYRNIEVINAPGYMAEFMQKCDAAISAGGNTLYELNYMKVKTIAYVAAENQLEFVENLAKEGALWNAGMYNEINYDEMYSQLTKYLETDRVNNKIVDGFGALRVADAIME